MNLGKLVAKLALGISLASAPVVYGCEEDTKEEVTYCSVDSQCKGDRICADGICQDPNEDNGNYYSGNNNGNQCGNSPFYGKYLWNIDCEMGFQFKKNCEFWSTEEHGSDFLDMGLIYNGTDVIAAEDKTYPADEGKTTIVKKGEKVFSFSRNFPCVEPIDPDYPNDQYTIETFCASLKCGLSLDSDYFVPVSSDGKPDLKDYSLSNIFVVKDEFFPGESNCQKQFLPLEEDLHQKCDKSNFL